MFKVKLEERQGTQEMHVSKGERILYCGLRNGFNLAHDCASGVCGTCKAVLVSGEVSSLWSEAPGNKIVREERNEFLMCQAVAKSDVHIKVRPAVPSPAPKPQPGTLKGVIKNHRSLNSNVAVFEYHLSQPVQFLAGQFATVQLEGIPGYRAYSMTNYSAEPTQSLHFVVKHIPGGKLTDWLFQQNRDGHELMGFGPVGRAVFAPESDGDFIVLAGGSGIAGIMAILQHASDCGHFEKYRGDVVFGLNGPQDVFFLDELNSLAGRYKNLRVIVALVEPDRSGSLTSDYLNLEFSEGYLSNVANEVLGDLSEITVAFVAGPPLAVETSQKMLVMERKVSARKMRFDRFG